MMLIVFLTLVGQLLVGIGARHPSFVPTGQFGDIKNFPYLVSVMVNGEHRCGGSIISPFFILTAGHCIYNVRPEDLKIRAGSSYMDRGGDLYHVERTYIYPFVSTRQQFDTGILKLATFLRYSEIVQPVHLPRRGQQIPPVGTMALVPGWGKKSAVSTLPSPYLMYTHVPLISHSVCSHLYRNTIFELYETMFCAGTNGQPCGGDSGGPLVIDGIQYGIGSLGACHVNNKPGMYYSVPRVRDYIFKVSGI